MDNSSKLRKYIRGMILEALTVVQSYPDGNVIVGYTKNDENEIRIDRNKFSDFLYSSDYLSSTSDFYDPGAFDGHGQMSATLSPGEWIDTADSDELSTAINDYLRQGGKILSGG